MANSLDRHVDAVLSQFPLEVWTTDRLGNAGGFSGAQLWRIESAPATWCLKAWPATMTRERLESIQHYTILARKAQLTFVPDLLRTRHGSTFLMHAGRLWETTEWARGCADFHARPTEPRIVAATEALAQLHVVWSKHSTRSEVAPAVERRFDAFHGWHAAVNSGWTPRWLPNDVVAPIARRAWDRLPAWLARIPAMLEPWRSRPMRLQPCVADIWHDHVFFEKDRLTAIIDYGSLRIDTPATDLARLLGSLTPRNEVLWRRGLTAYRAVAPLTDDEEKLVAVLDYAGSRLAIANWLLWLYRDERAFDDRTSVARRLAELVDNLNDGDDAIIGA